jgi:hypothetical protein
MINPREDLFYEKIYSTWIKNHKHSSCSRQNHNYDRPSQLHLGLSYKPVTLLPRLPD